MSNRYITWAFDVKGVTPSEKLVLIKLADQANDDGNCWPAQSTVASDCCLTRESVNRIIKKLADRGLVEVIARKQEGVALPNLYQLPSIERNLTERNFEGGSDGKSQGVVTQDHRGSDAGSHKPLVNPQYNQKDLLGDQPEKKKRRNPETPLPADCPSNDDKRYALKFYKEKGAALDVEDQAARFRDYHLAKDSRYRDWSAAWRTWLRNSLNFQNPKHGGSTTAPAKDRYAWSEGSRIIDG